MTMTMETKIRTLKTKMTFLSKEVLRIFFERLDHFLLRREMLYNQIANLKMPCIVFAEALLLEAAVISEGTVPLTLSMTR